jgi:hypothetical protein
VQILKKNSNCLVIYCNQRDKYSQELLTSFSNQLLYTASINVRITNIVDNIRVNKLQSFKSFTSCTDHTIALKGKPNIKTVYCYAQLRPGNRSTKIIQDLARLLEWVISYAVIKISHGEHEKSISNEQEALLETAITDRSYLINASTATAL